VTGTQGAVEATQRAQAAALQAGIEACRLRREPLVSDGETSLETRARCGGVAFWQLNEPWRAVTWSVIDRAGRPKAGYAAVQRAYQPVLVAAKFPRRAYVPARPSMWRFGP